MIGFGSGARLRYSHGMSTKMRWVCIIVVASAAVFLFFRGIALNKLYRVVINRATELQGRGESGEEALLFAGIVERLLFPLRYGDALPSLRRAFEGDYPDRTKLILQAAAEFSLRGGSERIHAAMLFEAAQNGGEEDAKESALAALRLREQFVPESQELASSLEQVAFLSPHQAAIPLLEKAIPIRIQGGELLLAAYDLRSLAAILKEAKRPSESVPLLLEALEMLLKSEHSELTLSDHNIRRLLAEPLQEEERSILTTLAALGRYQVASDYVIAASLLYEELFEAVIDTGAGPPVETVCRAWLRSLQDEGYRDEQSRDFRHASIACIKALGKSVS